MLTPFGGSYPNLTKVSLQEPSWNAQATSRIHIVTIIRIKTKHLLIFVLVVSWLGDINFGGIHKEIQEIETRQLSPSIRAIEVQPPDSNRVFVVLRAIASRDHIPFTPLDNVSLDLGRGPGRELSEKITRHTHCWFDSHHRSTWTGRQCTLIMVRRTQREVRRNQIPQALSQGLCKHGSNGIARHRYRATWTLAASTL